MASLGLQLSASVLVMPSLGQGNSSSSTANGMAMAAEVARLDWYV